MTAEALVQRATQALRAGAPQDAIAAIESAPAAQRNSQVAQRTLAAAHAQNGDLTAAQIAINRALAAPPIEPATRALAGRIALDLKQPANAFIHFETLVQIAPEQMGFWRYLWDSATTASTARRALQLGEQFKLDASADVQVAWAVTRTLVDESRANEVLAIAEQTVKRHAAVPAAQWLWVKRLTDEVPLMALRELQRVPTLPPVLDTDAVDAALAMPEQYADQDDVSAWRDRYGVGLQRLSMALTSADLGSDERRELVRHTAFRLAYHGRDDRSLQQLRGDLLCELMRPLTPIRKTNRTEEAKPSTRLRVGFVSKHIRDCTVGQYFKYFLTNLRDDRISVHVYACGQRDAFTDEVASRVDELRHFEDGDSTLLAIADAVVADAIDVLIYPEIGMEPIIEKLAAMRLAPLQCALWGHPVTTGLPTMDVFFSATALEPDGAQAHYRERLQLLPGLGTCYPTPPLPSRLERSALGLPETGPLIVCAQSPFKWNPDFTRAVAQILARTPTARLVVFDSPAANRARAFDDYLRHFFAPAGIDLTTRLVRLPQRGRADFIAALAACDLALDTFGFSGGNTSLDALSVGLPVVTLPGEFMRGRQTFAMLRALQSTTCEQLIAQDAAHYIDSVTRLLRDDEARAQLRDAIRINAHKLFNDPAPVAALRTWLQSESGLPD